MFEYENDLLIVDELIYDPAIQGACVIKVNEDYYMIRDSAARLSAKPIKEAEICQYKKTVTKYMPRATSDYQYLMSGMMPRNGFNIDLGRPITADEFEELCKKYSLTSSEVSQEFESKIGSIYGEKYAKNVKSIQVKVRPDQSIPLESELRNRGIEAGTGTSGRVNISTDWGGHREGAGRKSTGRRPARMYVTADEEKKLRDYLEKIREENHG